MNNSALSLEQTPPLAVPLLFMLTAPLFPVLASMVAMAYPESLYNRWDPAMLTITHLLTLGFITMVMVGALQQLFPVLVGVRLENPLLFSRVIYASLMTGTLILCSGFLLLTPVLTGAGALLLGGSLLWLIIKLMSSLIRSDATGHVTVGMRLALLSFLLTVSFGLYLTAGYTLPQVPLQRSLTSLHIRWGLFGWIGLLIFTVSYQVVPMFQVTPKYPDKMIRWLAITMFSSLVLITIIRLTGLLPHNLDSGIVFACECLMLSGFTLFALVTLRLQQQRRRKVADVTMDFWRFGLSCLLLALLMLALANAAQISIGDTDLVVGALLIVGFAMSLITGMLYKIIPFLVWLHLTNTIDISARWQMRIPNMKKIVPDKHARNQWRLHLLAVCLIMLSLMISSLVFAASAAFMLSNLYLAFNLIRGAAVYQRFVRQFNLAETD